MSTTHRSEIEEGVRASLSRAGIGAAYHGLSLKDKGEDGKALIEGLFSDRVRREIRMEGRPVIFSGIRHDGLELVKLVARGYHVNGVGCRVVPLVRLRGLLANLDEREYIEGCKVLVIQNFQTEKPDCPLTPYATEEVAAYIRERLEGNQSVWLHCPTRFQEGPSYLPVTSILSWWNAEFATWLYARAVKVRFADDGVTVT